MLDMQDWAWLKNVNIENVYIETATSENIICVQIVKGQYSNDVELTYPYEKEDYRGHIEKMSPLRMYRRLAVQALPLPDMMQTIW